MSELNELWSQMLSQAIENAKASGRHDVVDYLNLKARNDVIRQTGVRWLFDTLIEIAGDANRSIQSISIERAEPHNIAYRGANLTGTLIQLRQGVRCLSVEAGWTRTPSDGFMRGAAMAFARLSHRGIPAKNVEIALTVIDGIPEWRLIADEKQSGVFYYEHLREHVRVLTGD